MTEVAGSHRRRGQLRRVAGAGRPLLRGRRPGHARARADARRVRRVPRARHQVRRRVRRRRQEGRPRPVRGDPRQREQHHQDRRRAAARGAGAARAHPRRAGPLLPRDDHRVRRGAGRRRARCSARPRPTCSSPTCRWAPRRPTGSTRSARSTPGWRSSTRCRCSSRPTRCGRRSSATAGVPIVGDDIKSQVGATITHRVLAKLFEDRGVQLDRTMQLNVGGNMDFMNMMERERLESKKISKTQSVTSQIDRELGRDNVHIGPSDYVAWLDDRKWAYVRLEGRAFGDVPLNLEYKLEVWDSPNSAGIIIDAVRAAKIALDRGIGGPDPLGVELLHEVPAGAVLRRRGPRRRRGVHSRRDFVTFPDPNHSTIGGNITPGRPRARRFAEYSERNRDCCSRAAVIGVMEKGRNRFVMCRAASQTVVQPGRRVWGHRRSPSLPGACGAHLEDLRARSDPVPGDPRCRRGDRHHRRRPPHAAPRRAARHPVDGGGRAGGRERPGPVPGGAPRPRHNARPAAPSRPAVQAPVKLVAAAKPAAPAVAAAAGRRGSAMSIAMGKLGAPYRWGAAGPGAFDCSGLVYWSYRQTGMTLPRTQLGPVARRHARGQGRPAARRPGVLLPPGQPRRDLHRRRPGGARRARPGKPVKISNLNDMPFATARRI